MRRKLPAGLVGMFLLVTLVEGWFARHEIDFKTGWHWEWTVNGHASKAKAKAFDLLCFGDSQVNHGIIPGVLEESSGSRALNLALSGGQATTSYFQLKRALDSGARPRAVLVDFFPLLLNHGIEENFARWPDLLTIRETLELALAAGNAEFFARTMVQKALVSFQERDGVRTSLMKAFEGTYHTQRYEALSQRRNWKMNEGGLVFERNPKLNLGDLDRWYSAAFPNKEWIAPYHAVYLTKFLDLAKSHGVRVYWLVPPVPPEVQAKFREKGEDDRFASLVNGVLARYPDVTVLDARHSAYPNDVFVDHGHLDRVGANTFTRDVGALVRRGPTGRWVDLPPFRVLPEHPAVEDIGQSRQVVLKDLGLIPR